MKGKSSTQEGSHVGVDELRCREEPRCLHAHLDKRSRKERQRTNLITPRGQERAESNQAL